MSMHPCSEPLPLVVIVAAGRGQRAGGEIPKQWQILAGKPVLAHTLACFTGFPVMLAVHPEDFDRARVIAGAARLVNGGATRAQSVRNALEEAAGQGFTRVLIHDGARPLASSALIARVIAALDQASAAAPALTVTDALWRGTGGIVAGTMAREGLYRAQTPQGFHFDAILAAHRAYQGDAADDVEIARAAGLDVLIVEGEENNLKLTYPPDFLRAEAILNRHVMETGSIRIGNGFDVHAFGPGDHVWLCGIRIPHDRALIGHSDADVGLHALADAIYGALADGDIGRHFPPSDPQWKGADSAIFLRHAADLARSRGYHLGNCDVTILCERPKITPHAAAMRARLAEIMGVEPDQISVKASTTERLGFTGREEGIAAITSVLLARS